MNKTKGGVTIKTINGNKYYYYQWYENGKRRSKTISEQEYYNYLNSDKTVLTNNSNVLYTGNSLKELIKRVGDYKKRYCYTNLRSFLYEPTAAKVFILYGLRRSGKTTLIYQALKGMNEDDFSKSAYILANDKYDLGQLNTLMNNLYESGYRFVFIDEVTFIPDFIDGCQFLADIYGSLMHVVLSGTDSLGFLIASNNALYNRTITVHTTYIPFKEFSEVLGIDNVDTYIEYGGTMVKEGIDYHHNISPVFYDEESTISYIDSAIIANIQHSLNNYKDGRNYERLTSLKESGELTNVINRIIQDENHRFLVEVINRTFKSNDYGSLKELVRKNDYSPYLRTFIDTVDENKIYQLLIDALDIHNTILDIDEATMTDLYTYLKMLDVIKEIDVLNVETGKRNKRIVFTQPGLRYSQVKSLVESMLNSDEFSTLPEDLISFLENLTLNDVKGRILEDIVLLETQLIKKEETVKLKFLYGEIDMGIYKNHQIHLYEVKHSHTINEMQARHLKNEEYMKLLSSKYNKVASKNILYQGPNTIVDGINYLNVSDYLKE